MVAIFFKFNFPGKSCLFTATSGQIILFLFKSHHFRTYFLYMIRYNNISRPVHDHPCLNSGGCDSQPPGLRPLRLMKKIILSVGVGLIEWLMIFQYHFIHTILSILSYNAVLSAIQRTDLYQNHVIISSLSSNKGNWGYTFPGMSIQNGGYKEAIRRSWCNTISLYHEWGLLWLRHEPLPVIGPALWNQRPFFDMLILIKSQVPLFVLSKLFFSLQVSCTESASGWCALLQEALPKCVDTKIMFLILLL